MVLLEIPMHVQSLCNQLDASALYHLANKQNIFENQQIFKKDVVDVSSEIIDLCSWCFVRHKLAPPLKLIDPLQKRKKSTHTHTHTHTQEVGLVIVCDMLWPISLTEDKCKGLVVTVFKHHTET